MYPNDQQPQGLPGQPGQPGQWDYGQPGYPPGYAPPPGYPMGPPPPQGTNGLAIAAFVSSLLGFCFLGIPFGFIALSQIKQRNQGGRGLAIAGLIISGLSVLLAVAIFALAAIGASHDSASQDNSTRSVAPDGPTSVSISDMKTGDCVQSIEEKDHIRKVTLVPCTAAHDAEVITQVTLTGAWPGSADAAFAKANDSCGDQVDKLVGGSPMYDKLETFILYPNTESQWNLSNGRATCMVHNANGSKLTGKVPR